MNNYFEQGPIRPPSEATSLLIRVTRNCSVINQDHAIAIFSFINRLSFLSTAHHHTGVIFGAVHPALISSTLPASGAPPAIARASVVYAAT